MTDEEIWEIEEKRGDHDPGCNLGVLGCVLLAFGPAFLAAIWFGLSHLGDPVRS